MERTRMGQLLSEIGKLTAHDVDEILAEQRHTRQRFGAVAVSLGFCLPEHVWAAWCAQLSADRVDVVDLDEIGIDAQAVECLPRDLALGLRAMPVRVFETHLIVAVSDPERTGGVVALARRIDMQIKCVLATDVQVERALAKYYPTLPVAC